MPEPIDDAAEPRPRERSLVWFYVVLGLAAAILAGGALAWKPLEAAHWERRTREAFERGDVRSAGDALDKLEALGPAARAAAGRLLAPNGAWYRGQVIQDIGRKENRWLLPALVRLAREERDTAVVHLAVSAAEPMSGRIFFPLTPTAGRTGVEEARGRFIAWWERDGQAKYGG